MAKEKSPNAKFIVVGSKASLPTENRQVTDKKVEEFLRDNAKALGEDCQFVKVDAKSGAGIKESLDGSTAFCSALDTLAKALNASAVELNSSAVEQDSSAVEQDSSAKNNRVRREYFPKSYTSLSKLPKSSEELVPLQKLRLQILKVLEDYSGYRPFLGIFSKAGFFHPGRHHRQEVKEIISEYKLTDATECSAKQIVGTFFRLSRIDKKHGGSLDRRLQFIKQLIDTCNNNIDSIFSADQQEEIEDYHRKQNYKDRGSAPIQYEARP